MQLRASQRNINQLNLECCCLCCSQDVEHTFPESCLDREFHIICNVFSGTRNRLTPRPHRRDGRLVRIDAERHRVGIGQMRLAVESQCRSARSSSGNGQLANNLNGLIARSKQRQAHLKHLPVRLLPSGCSSDKVLFFRLKDDGMPSA
jgi:hypothetical protein